MPTFVPTVGLLAPGSTLPSAFPGPEAQWQSSRFAPRLQRRDRAGIAPASRTMGYAPCTVARSRTARYGSLACSLRCREWRQPCSQHVPRRASSGEQPGAGIGIAGLASLQRGAMGFEDRSPPRVAGGEPVGMRLSAQLRTTTRLAVVAFIVGTINTASGALFSGV